MENFQDDLSKGRKYDLGRPVQRRKTSTLDSSSSFIKVTGNDHDLKHLDLNGDGAISYDELVAFNQQHLLTRSNAKFYKKIAIATLLALVLLICANIGTATLAINLTKEMRVASDGTLQSVAGGTALKTETKAFTVAASSPIRGNGTAVGGTDRRLVQDPATNSTYEFLGCFDEEESSAMISALQSGATVHISTTNSQGENSGFVSVTANEMRFNNERDAEGNIVNDAVEVFNTPNALYERLEVYTDQSLCPKIWYNEEESNWQPCTGEDCFNNNDELYYYHDDGSCRYQFYNYDAEAWVYYNDCTYDDVEGCTCNPDMQSTGNERKRGLRTHRNEKPQVSSGKAKRRLLCKSESCANGAQKVARAWTNRPKLQ